VTSSIEMPEAATDPEPNPDNTLTPEGIQRRSFGGWFRRMIKRNRNRSHQIPPEDFPQTDARQAKPPPSNQKASIITRGQRIRRVVQWIGDEPAEQATQKTPPAGEQSKVTPSVEQPKATTQLDVDPANPPDDARQESSGVQHTIEQRPGKPSWQKLDLYCSIWVPSWLCCGCTVHSDETR